MSENNSNNAATKTDTAPTKSAAEQALDLVTNPKMKLLLEASEQVQKLVKQSSTSHIVDKGAGRGFSDFNVISDLEEARGLTQAALERWLAEDGESMLKTLQKNGATSETSDDCRRILRRAVELLACDGELYRKQLFSLGFQMGNGSCVALFVYFEKRDDGKFNFKKLAMTGKFALAPDWVVVRKTKDSFFSSSSKDEIHYVPRGITGDDVAAIMDVVVPRVVDQMIKLVPDSDKKAITQ